MSLMPGSDGLRILEFVKNSELRLGLDEESRFSKLAEARPVVCGGAARSGGQMEKSA